MYLCWSVGSVSYCLRRPTKPKFLVLLLCTKMSQNSSSFERFSGWKYLLSVSRSPPCCTMHCMSMSKTFTMFYFMICFTWWSIFLSKSDRLIQSLKKWWPIAFVIRQTLHVVALSVWVEIIRKIFVSIFQTLLFKTNNFYLASISNINSD